jgi:hypothetical protein
MYTDVVSSYPSHMVRAATVHPQPPEPCTGGKGPLLLGRWLDLQSLPIAEIIAQSIPPLSKFLCVCGSSKASRVVTSGEVALGYRTQTGRISGRPSREYLGPPSPQPAAPSRHA